MPAAGSAGWSSSLWWRGSVDVDVFDFGRAIRGWRNDVGSESLEVAVEGVELGGGESFAELTVEGDHGIEQREEERLSALGELDELGAPVLGRPVSGEEARGL